MKPDRKGFIGGSDIAAIIGCSPWKDQLALYLEKRGEIEGPEEETRAQRRGKILEPAIIELYKAERAVVGDVREGGTFSVAGLEHFRAQVDATEMVDEWRIPDEIKSSSEFTRGKWGPDGTDDAPIYYLTQLQWQMLALEAPFGRIVAFLGSDDLRVYPVEADHDVQRFLLAEAGAFWRRVQDGDPPEPDWQHPNMLDTLARIYRRPNAAEIVKATPAIRAWREVYEDAAEHITRYEKVRDGAKAHLLDFMRSAALIDFDDGTCFERKVVKRRGYTVADTEYVSGTLKKMPAGGKPALTQEIAA